MARRKIALAAMLIAAAAVCQAQIPSSEESDPQALFDNGDYADARTLLESKIAAAPKAKNVGELQLLLGRCAEEEGDLEAAMQAYQAATVKGVADAWLPLGRLKFRDFDFDGASAAYSKYRTLKTKARKPVDEALETDEQRLADAENFLERVERLEIIDSIAVSLDDLLKAYRLSPSSGSLRDVAAIPKGLTDTAPASVFVNEAGDVMMWSEPDPETGRYAIVEAMRLTDGNWHKETQPFRDLAENGDADYPFLMSDGTTLYFAADGEGSIGGYDIFVASSDPSTGEFMQPQNLGMPYNSPDDDFLLAIDELNGVGWWATDRNHLGDDMVTLYVFLTSDLRRNYDPEDEAIVDYARIASYQDTWPEDADYTEILSTIASIDPNQPLPKSEDFRFPLSRGRVYTTLSDFKTQAARSAMQAYLKGEKELAESEAQLKNLRRKLHEGRSAALETQLRQLEQKTMQQREDLKRLRNEVYKAEK